MRLGIVTDTDDITGTVKKQADASALEELTGSASFEQKLVCRFESFLGPGMQVPPMYSAIKINGKKLYEYARAGIEIEREPRPVEIFELVLLDILDEKDVRFKVRCSKGTYVRALIRDIGESLGVGATMSGLLRDEVNGIRSDSGYRVDTLSELKESGNLETTVLPMDELLKVYPAVTSKSGGRKYLNNGNRISINLISKVDGKDIDDVYLTEIQNADFIRVYSENALKALYTYDKTKNDFKVFKML
jgi:tRNA pseudouridine55 synthase